MKRVLLMCMVLFMVSCLEKDDVNESVLVTDSYTLVYTTKHLPNTHRVYAESTVFYLDSFEFISSEYNEELNTVTIKTKAGPIKIDSNIYAEGGSEVLVVLYNNAGIIVDETSFSQETFNYIYEF